MACSEKKSFAFRGGELALYIEAKQAVVPNKWDEICCYMIENNKNQTEEGLRKRMSSAIAENKDSVNVKFENTFQENQVRPKYEM